MRNPLSEEDQIIAWDADIDVPIIKKIFQRKVKDVDYFLETIFDGISQDLEGTRTLRFKDAHEFPFLNLSV